MSDLIDRQKAIEALDFEIVYMTVFSNDEKNITNPFAQYNKGLEDGIKAIRALPSAEPERKKGRWEVQPSTGGDRPFIWWKCSECGYVIFSETERDRREFHAFCGRCGAEMTR